uniref:Putative ionotropic receptor ligand binding domain-containing protein n=1 Tax=Stomoxys calcitrans TaxID=35570 RepID=A0A1I8QEG7_STOCA
MKAAINVSNLVEYEVSRIEQSQVNLDETNAIVAHSLRVIILEFFMSFSSSFMIVVSCRRSQQFNFFLNILQHLFEMIGDMNVQIVFVDYLKPERIEGNRFQNLLLVDSFEAFLDIDVISYTKDYDINEYYHIFLMQEDSLIPGDMQNIFTYCWNNQIVNCNVQYQNERDQLFIYTYLPFGAMRKCGNTSPELINEFIDNDWQQRPFFVPKTTNFHRCPLVGIIRTNPPYAFALPGRRQRYSGFEAVMVRELSLILNFTLVLRNADDRYYPEPDGVLTMLSNRTANFAFGYYRRRPFGLHLYTNTATHYQSSVLGAICVRGHFLNPFQVLAYPFRLSTWAALIACFVLVLTVTRVVHGRRPKAMATFSMVTSTFGLPIKKKPRMLSSYLLFTPWLWGTFLLRCIYSGLLFHFFSNNVYQPLPQSIEAARNQSYTSVMNSFTFFYITDIPYYGRINHWNHANIVLNSTSEFVPLEYLEEHTDENIFAVIAQEFLTHYTVTHGKVGLFYVMPEAVMQQHLCIYFTKHTILAEQFDLTLSLLKSMGLMRLWIKRYFDLKVLSQVSTDDNKMIKQRDLYGVYAICGGFYLLGMFVCLLEFLTLKYKKLKILFD